jgi:small subunit ribosomal protein S16
LVKIRLQRHGRKRLPYYHIVIADSRARRDGRIIEDLGRYSPTQQPAMVKVDVARAIHWINNGAQPTDTVRSILKKEGVYLRMHLMRWNKTEEEIDQAVAEFKAKKGDKGLSSSDQRKAAFKLEEEQFKKDEAVRAVEAEKKAKDAEAKAAADKKAAEEAAAKALEAPVEEVVAEEAPEAEAIADEAPAAEEVATEEAPEAEAVTEEAPATEKVEEVATEETPADEAEESSEDKKAE